MHLNSRNYYIYIYYSMNTVIMSNLTKLEINALDITGNNYMTWAVGAKMHLRGKRLLETIDNSKTVSDEKKGKSHDILTTPHTSWFKR